MAAGVGPVGRDEAWPPASAWAGTGHDEIAEHVEQLFAMVTEGLAAATEALLSGDREVVRVLVERDGAADEVYRTVESLVTTAITDGGLTPSQLRALVSVLRVAPELERSHDLVEHIARRGSAGIGAALSPRARGLVQRMGTGGVEMWQLVADGWARRDASVAEVLEGRDDELDELHAALSAEVARGDQPLPVAMEATLVARFFERLGDHAVNIARRIPSL